MAFRNGKDRVIRTKTNITAWMPFGAALTAQDIAWDDKLTTEFFNAKALGV